jgi:hypothetical protein
LAQLSVGPRGGGSLFDRRHVLFRLVCVCKYRRRETVRRRRKGTVQACLHRAQARDGALDGRKQIATQTQQHGGSTLLRTERRLGLA